MRSNDSQKVIAVGIPKSMDDAGLSELFGAFGTVAEAKVVLDAASSASRGFGFVTFTSSVAMRAAIKGLDQTKVEGRVLNVRQLVPKDKFQQQRQSDERAAADPSKRPCWLLRKGKCTKGDSCPFSHETQGGDFGSCFEFAQTGSCKRGDACKFYHPPATEGGADGDSSQPKAAVAAADDKKKEKKDSKMKGGDKPQKRVCYAFQSGRCHRGKSCMFMHKKLPADAAPEAKQDKKKAVKKAGDFEVVASSAGDAGRKRTRDEMEGAPVADSSDSESEDDDVGDDSKAEQQTQPQPHKTAKSQPKTVKTVNNKPAAVASKPSEAKAKVHAKAKAAPLAGLAAHVSSFMQQQQSAPVTADKKADKPSELAQRRRDAPTPSAKRQKTEKIDMGAAFDSDSDEPRGPARKPLDKEAMRAARDKAKADRRSKRSAKKQALSRLRTTGEVDLEADA